MENRIICEACGEYSCDCDCSDPEDNNINEQINRLRYESSFLQSLKEDQDKSFTVREIRACPQDDGTIIYLGGDGDGNQSKLLMPKDAFNLMRAGIPLTLALNDPDDVRSNWESDDCITFVKL